MVIYDYANEPPISHILLSVLMPVPRYHFGLVQNPPRPSHLLLMLPSKSLCFSAAFSLRPLRKPHFTEKTLDQRPHPKCVLVNRPDLPNRAVFLLLNASLPLLPGQAWPCRDCSIQFGRGRRPGGTYNRYFHIG